MPLGPPKNAAHEFDAGFQAGFDAGHTWALTSTPDAQGAVDAAASLLHGYVCRHKPPCDCTKERLLELLRSDFSRDGVADRDSRSGRGASSATASSQEATGPSRASSLEKGLLRSAREGEDRSNQPASPIPPSPWTMRWLRGL